MTDRVEDVLGDVAAVAVALRHSGNRSDAALLREAAALIREQRDEIAALRHDIERHVAIASEYAGDAERYRRLREHEAATLLNVLTDGWGFFGDAGMQLDDVVDALRASTEKDA